MINKICLICNKDFKTYSSRIRIGKGKYCSKECSFKSLVGHVSPKKGVKLTSEQKKKMNINGLKLGWGWNKGKQMPTLKNHTHGFKKGFIPWNKGLKGFLGGIKHWNWKNGISKINKPERVFMMSTFEYKLWRQSVFTRDNFTCIWCGQIRGNIEADHIKSWRDYPELRFAIDNGRTLCHNCHVKTDSYGYKNRKAYVK